MFKAILLDIDGTLVDSNDAHARAWVSAFAEAGVSVDFHAVRRAIGMGGDKLMRAVSGIAEESPEGQRISKRRRDIFLREHVPRLERLPGADRLVAALKDRGFRVVAATSAKQDELRPLLDVAGATSLLEDATSSDDADESKPDPDIVEAALKRADVQPHEAVMIGDTPYDVEAATRAAVATIAFRSGGWEDDDLRGTLAIYDGPWDLLARLDESPLARPG